MDEHVHFSCDEGVGTACDYPTWTPEALQDSDFCWEASDVSGCSGILYGFTGTLRIEALADGFQVTYDGTYAGWDGDC